MTENVGLNMMNDTETASTTRENIEVEDESGGSDMLYTVDDTPPWYQCMALGFQHYLTMFGSTVSIPLIITPAMCLLPDDPDRGYIFSTIMFVSGIVTLLQATFGIRLSIVQGGTFAFVTPTLTLLSLPEWKCPAVDVIGAMSAVDKQELWQSRMRELQGAIIVASLFQVVLSFTGVVGLLLRLITPLTIVPTITMIGLALFDVAKDKVAGNWGIGIMTIVIVTLCSQYLRDVKVPLPRYRRPAVWVSVFKLFPIIFGIGISWLVCAVLTAGGFLSEDSTIRTDTNLNALYKASWFRVPYPCQWGLPTVSLSAVLGMLAAVISSIIESVGDYYACAKVSGAPPPPVHAVNRGICIEGIGSILAGLLGTGNGTTSYSENIGAIGITKVASRRVIQWGGLIMILFGLTGKFGAIVLLIPSPVVGGMFVVMFGMISAVGLSSLQYVNLNSSRNLFVLGFSIMFAFVVPRYMQENPGILSTGSTTFDQILYVLLSTNMFVAGFVGCLLDNTIPGTAQERGLDTWRSKLTSGRDNTATYNLPFGMNLIKKWKWTRYIPISPTYRGFPVQRCCSRNNDDENITQVL